MKKLITLLLALAMLLSLCACGGGSKENVIGTYTNVSVFLDTTYALNENTTYEKAEPSEKGTYEPNSKGGFSLTKAGENPSSDDPIFIKEDSYYYQRNGKYSFEKDTEFGLEPTFDDNGRSDQDFISYYEVLSDKSGWLTLALDLHEDGTFVLSDYIKSTLQATVKNNHEGTYSLEGNVLNLNYDDKDHIMLIIKDKIYFNVLEKSA